MLRVDVEKRLGTFELRAAFESDSGITALFGRSGAGKSSLINIIAGLTRPDRGRVEVNGQVLFDAGRGLNVPVERRRVGYVFQEGRLFPHFTVRRNLLYGHALTPEHERYVTFDHVVGLLGLAHLLERRPGALSGGEKQRVAIGRALLASPRILLMDEPLAALDLHRKSEILQYIELLRDEIRIPIVYVSHAIEEVVRLADVMVVMSEGSVAGVGAVEEVMSRFDLRQHTGRYEGGAVIEAKVAAHDLRYDLTRLRFSGGELTVAGLDALIGEPVRVRIRARDVSLALQPPPEVSILNVLAGKIVQIRHEAGPMAEVLVDVDGATLIARITRSSADRLGLIQGQMVYAMIKAISLDRHSVGYA